MEQQPLRQQIVGNMPSYAHIPTHDLRVDVVKRSKYPCVLLLMRGHFREIQFIHPRFLFAECALHLLDKCSEFRAEIRILAARQFVQRTEKAVMQSIHGRYTRRNV